MSKEIKTLKGIDCIKCFENWDFGTCDLIDIEVLGKRVVDRTYVVDVEFSVEEKLIKLYVMDDEIVMDNDERCKSTCYFEDELYENDAYQDFEVVVVFKNNRDEIDAICHPYALWPNEEWEETTLTLDIEEWKEKVLPIYKKNGKELGYDIEIIERS